MRRYARQSEGARVREHLGMQAIIFNSVCECERVERSEIQAGRDQARKRCERERNAKRANFAQLARYGVAEGLGVGEGCGVA
ncbi:MAG: hypothetical protein NVS1B14_02790 [Vulcanimicrobiaceae bacterium]